MISWICGAVGYENAYLVVAAASMTMGITVILTIYALTTKTDFTMMGGAIWMVSMIFFMWGLFFIIWTTSRIVEITYCTICCIIYGFYLIYDT